MLNTDHNHAHPPAAPSAGHNDEVELKLLAPGGTLAPLRHAPIIARYARNAGTARRLEAIYYDTPDRALLNHGLSLRIRRSGARYIQTLKREPAHGQPFQRQEWEAAVQGMTPDLAALPTAEIGAPLDRLATDALGPVFSTKVRRRTQRLELPDAVIELALDEGTIEAGANREPLAEVELEVKSGDPGAMYELGIQLLDVMPLRVGTLSKSSRGYSLANGADPHASKAKAPVIAHEDTLDDVIATLLASCQHHLLANQEVAMRGRDPEGVHQMRVALRRLRTACTLLHREVGSPTLRTIGDEAKWLAQLLGKPRDWDVFIHETLQRPALAGGALVDFDSLQRAAEPHRTRGYTELQQAVADPRYNRFLLSLSRWIVARGWRNELNGQPLAVLVEPAQALAERVLSRLHRKALKRGAHFRRLQPEARHKLRIALKKLRYAAEFYQTLYAELPTAKQYVGCLARLQDALGHDNDATVTYPLISALARDAVAPDVQRAIGAIIGWQAHERAATGKRLRKRWRRFKAMPTFW